MFIVMKEKLINFIHNMGITEIGFTKTDDGNFAVVCLFPYYIDIKEDRTISRYAVSVDYHKIIAGYLKKISDFIKENGFSAEGLVDIGDPVERKYAYKSGLGFFGENGMLINDKYGSYTFIGYVKTNMVFEENKPLDKKCLGCGKCKEACPGNMEKGICASEISQRRGELSIQEKEILVKSGLIWGCDICQDVCPHNENVEETTIKEFKENLIFSPDINEIEGLSNKEFMKKYKERAFSWRGKNPLVRNRKIFKVIKNAF